jgi:hypothetical protein
LEESKSQIEWKINFGICVEHPKNEKNKVIEKKVEKPKIEHLSPVKVKKYGP